MSSDWSLGDTVHYHFCFLVSLCFGWSLVANVPILEQKLGWSAAHGWGIWRPTRPPEERWRVGEARQQLARNEKTQPSSQIEMFFPLTFVHYLWPLPHNNFLYSSCTLLTLQSLQAFPRNHRISIYHMLLPSVLGERLLLNHLMVKQWPAIFSPP